MKNVKTEIVRIKQSREEVIVAVDNKRKRRVASFVDVYKKKQQGTKKKTN